MGDVSDAMVDGEVCGGCGVFFVRAHGFPVLCESCWNAWSPRERQGFQRAMEPEL